MTINFGYFSVHIGYCAHARNDNNLWLFRTSIRSELSQKNYTITVMFDARTSSAMTLNNNCFTNVRNSFFWQHSNIIADGTLMNEIIFSRRQASRWSQLTVHPAACQLHPSLSRQTCVLPDVMPHYFTYMPSARRHLTCAIAAAPHQSSYPVMPSSSRRLAYCSASPYGVWPLDASHALATARAPHSNSPALSGRSNSFTTWWPAAPAKWIRHLASPKMHSAFLARTSKTPDLVSNADPTLRVSAAIWRTLSYSKPLRVRHLNPSAT